ncbi:MAG: hypothetical protein Q4F72_08445, partial [Desulfovibrionaceae bacterium]|nr:hypothetical protein [Desulfovibrionaceae bacterium]
MRDVMTKIEDEAKDLSLRAAGSEVRGGAAGRHVLSGDMPTMDEAVRLWVEQHPDDAMEAEAARRMDQLGDGGAEDEALEELLRLQEGGSVLASYVFAAMQLDREHPEARDAGLALMTYAADRGFPPACWHMAADCLTETGEDAFNRSWEWLGRGAMAGSCECCVEMGSLFLNSAVHLPEESCRMLAEQLLDFARSGSWKPLETLLNLGLAKVPGTMPAEALDEALALLLEYAEGGHVPAMTLAGVMHAEGRLLERDRHEAARWLKGAWQAGSAEGGCQLARLWLNDPAADRAETEEAREILEICCLDDNALAHALMARTAME